MGCTRNALRTGALAFVEKIIPEQDFEENSAKNRKQERFYVKAVKVRRTPRLVTNRGQLAIFFFTFFNFNSYW
jgi:hypothetical protein